MAEQENLRRGILPIIAPQRERTVTPVLPRPHVRTAPEFPEHGKLPETTKKLGTKTRIALAGLTLLEAGGAIANEQFNEQPISTQTVVQDLAWPWNLGKSAVEDIQRIFSKEAPVSPIFDRKTDSAVIKAGVNAVQATNEDLAKIENNITPPPNPTEEHGLPALPQFTLFLPFLLKDGDQISMTKNYMGPGINMSTGKAVEPGYTAGINFIVSRKDTEMTSGIVDPDAVSIEVFKNPPFITDKEYFGGVIIKVTRRDGSQYVEGYMSPDDVRGLVPLPILDNAPVYMKGQNIDGLHIAATDPIMKTGIANAPIRFGTSRVAKSKSVSDIAFSDINLFTSSSKVLHSPQQ